MEQEYLKRIYQEYLKDSTEQTKQEQEHQEEQGFGLSIAKEILDQNGGSIDIKSIQDKGTEVVIRVPTKTSETRQKNDEEA